MAEQAESVEKRIENYLFETEGGEPPPGYQEETPEQPAKPPVVSSDEQDDDEPPPRKKAEPEQEQAQAEEPDEEVEEISVSSLNDLAEALGVDVADLYKVPIPINTPDGRKEISLGEWKDSVQAAESLKSERAKLAEMTQQRQQELQRFSNEVNTGLQQVGALIQMAESELVRDYQAINWQELRQYDPAEFSAKQTEFAQRQGQIQQAKQAALMNAQAAQQKQFEMLEAALPEQAKKMLELVPEWADDNTAQVEKPKVADFLIASGFAPEEIRTSLYDARAMALAYKAWKYDQLKQSKPAKKKVLKIGNKPIKPGKAQSKSEQRESQSRDQRMRFKKTGNIHDLASLLNTDEYLGDM